MATAVSAGSKKDTLFLPVAEPPVGVLLLLEEGRLGGRESVPISPPLSPSASSGGV